MEVITTVGLPEIEKDSFHYVVRIVYMEHKNCEFRELSKHKTTESFRKTTTPPERLIKVQRVQAST